MLLHDTAIAHALDTDRITITPEPTAEQIQPASFDVRIGDTLTLRPGEPRQPYTLDCIGLPNDVGALLTGRSSVARDHVIVHKTAGWIDPGFEGNITLEMYNFGDDPVEFERGDRVAQLLFMQTQAPSKGYTGQYMHQGPGVE